MLKDISQMTTGASTGSCWDFSCSLCRSLAVQSGPPGLPSTPVSASGYAELAAELCEHISLLLPMLFTLPRMFFPSLFTHQTPVHCLSLDQVPCSEMPFLNTPFWAWCFHLVTLSCHFLIGSVSSMRAGAVPTLSLCLWLRARHKVGAQLSEWLISEYMVLKCMQETDGRWGVTG